MLNLHFTPSIQRIVQKLTAFKNHQSGTVAVTTAIMSVIVVGTVGAAIDYARAVSLKASMQAAADTAVLAAAKANENQHSIATNMFNVNVRKPFKAESFNLTATDGGAFLRVTSSVPTTLLNVMGIPKINVAVISEAKEINAIRAEFVVAFDVTNSMFFSPTEMPLAIKTMQNFVDKMFASSRSGNITGSVMPFSDRVRLPNFASSWATGTMPGGWNGCMKPREQISGTWKHALTDDLPSARPFQFQQTPEVKNTPGAMGNGYPVNCYGSTITVAKKDADSLRNALGNMGMGGTGRYDEAMAWAGRLLSPKWQGMWGLAGYPSSANAAKKMVVFISDGRTVIYGHEALRDSGVPREFGWNMGGPDGFENMNRVCTELKQQDIDIYVLQLNGNSNATPFFRSCASEPSQHFMITSLNEFQNAFGNIGVRFEKKLALTR